jgi:hypothetical protein
MIGASYDGFQLPQRVAVGRWSMALADAFCVTIFIFRSPAQHWSHTEQSEIHPPIRVTSSQPAFTYERPNGRSDDVLLFLSETKLSQSCQ